MQRSLSHLGMGNLLVSQWKHPVVFKWTISLNSACKFWFPKTPTGPISSWRLKSFCCVPSWTSGGEHIKMHISPKSISLHLRAESSTDCPSAPKAANTHSRSAAVGERAKPERMRANLGAAFRRSPSPPKVCFLLFTECALFRKTRRAKKMGQPPRISLSHLRARLCVRAMAAKVCVREICISPERVLRELKGIAPVWCQGGVGWSEAFRTIKAVLSLVILIANRRHRMLSAVRTGQQPYHICVARCF